LNDDGILLLRDIKRNWIGYFIKPYRSAFIEKEAIEEISKSKLRSYRLLKGFFWWAIETSENVKS